jgi:hypothetical protein
VEEEKMKPRLFHTAIGVLAIAAALGAAERQTGSASARGSAYTLTIQAKQPEYKVGSEIWVEVAFKNVSNREIEITPRLEGLGNLELASHYYITDIRDQKGNPAQETELGQAARADTGLIGSFTSSLGGHDDPLRPGESRPNEIHLNKLYDLSKPGKYTVQVQFRDTNGPAVKSNRITITVTK